MHSLVTLRRANETKHYRDLHPDNFEGDMGSF